MTCQAEIEVLQMLASSLDRTAWPQVRVRAGESNGWEAPWALWFTAGQLNRC
jgi:hypothetical protein